MDGILSQPALQAPSASAEAASQKPTSIFEQLALPAPTQSKEVVHAFVWVPPKSRGRASRARLSPAGASWATNSIVSTLGSYGGSSGGSPYLTSSPVAEGDEPPPFRPEKGDRISLSMYEGPQNFEVKEPQCSQEMTGEVHGPPRTISSLGGRRREKHRITGRIDFGGCDDTLRATASIHNTQVTESDGHSIVSSSRFLTSPTSREDRHVSHSPRAKRADAPPSSGPIRKTQPSGQRGQGNGLLHQAIFNHKWSMDVSAVPLPSFVTTLTGLYNRSTSSVESSQESVEIQEEQRNNKDQRGGDNGSERRKQRERRKVRVDNPHRIPDTPATIILRRASGSNYRMENGKMSVEESSRMSRQRENDLRDSIINSFLEGKHKARRNEQDAGQINKRTEGVERGGSSIPNLHLATDKSAKPFDHNLRRRSLFKDFGFPHPRARRETAISSPSSIATPGRSRIAEPVTTYIASRKSSFFDQGASSTIDEERSTSTVQSIHSNNSVFEVIWQDDHTPSDLVTKQLEQPSGSSNSSEVFYPGNSCLSSDSDESSRRRETEKQLQVHRLIGRSPDRLPGWSWSGSSRHDSRGACVQFGFQLSSDSPPIQKTLSTEDQMLDTATSELFIDSFPPLPERKSTLDWTKPPPSIDVSDSPPSAHTPHHAKPPTAEPITEKRSDFEPDNGRSSPPSSYLDHLPARGREPRRQSVVLYHPAAHPRTADVTKMGFALGISGGRRRRRSSNPARARKTLSPRRPSIQRGHSASRIQDLKWEANELAPTCLSTPLSDAKFDDLAGPRKASSPSRLSGSSTPRSTSEAKRSATSGPDQGQVELPSITVETIHLSSSCPKCIDSAGGGVKFGSRASVDWIG